jgi:hypothetical protein
MPELLHFDVDPAGEPPWLHGLVLGWKETDPPYRTLIVASEEDSIAVLGPPRVGKTSGVLIPQALTWAGALISASTKPDVLHATRGRRAEVARHHGGGVYVYAPTDSREEIEGVPNIRWTPTSGCEDPNVCELRVQNILGPEKRHEDAFFRQQAATVMRGFFHAAALERCELRRLKSWIDGLDVEGAVDILRRHTSESYGADGYASALEGVAHQADSTRSSTFSTVSEKLAAVVGNAAVLATAGRGDFDIDRFLRTGSSLFVVSPEDTQRVVAPLVAGFIEAIVSRAYALAREEPAGRLSPPLAMLLDEVGAIAPLPSLPAIMAQGAGQGVLCVWAAQSITQLRARWEEDWANAIWGASTQKLIFGNLGDTELLEKVSQSFGEYDRPVATYHRLQPLFSAMQGQVPPQPTIMRERNLPVAQLYGQPPGTACVVGVGAAGPSFSFLGAPPAAVTPPFSAIPDDEVSVQRLLQQLQAPVPIQMHSPEQRRLEAEAERLMEHIERVEALDPEARLREISTDPDLAREVGAARRMPSGAAGSERRRALIERLVEEGAPKFTLVPAGEPQPGSTGIGRAEPSSTSLRQPDRYKLKYD